MPLTAQPAGQSYSNGCLRNAWRRKKTSEQIYTAVMINVMLHPAVNIHECCSFEKWSLIWATLAKPSGEQVVHFLWCTSCWEKRPNWGLKIRIIRWWDSWHIDLENGCKITTWDAVLLLIQKQKVSLLLSFLKRSWGLICHREWSKLQKHQTRYEYQTSRSLSEQLCWFLSCMLPYRRMAEGQISAVFL